MPEPGKWHLKPPPLVISTLNHIRESDSVRAGLPRPPHPLRLTEAGSSGEGPSRQRPGSDDVYGRFGRVRSKNTDVRALADSSGRARLVIYDVSAGPSPSSNRAHGPDSEKPNRRADLPGAQCTGSDLFSVHL